MKYECTRDKFLHDVEDFNMTIIKDDGIYRHLRFKHPETRTMSFDILTWPGHLCYTGDMGSYLFSRVNDMFEFFRHGKDEDVLYVNPPYWSEKVLALDKCGYIREYDPEKFEKYVKGEAVEMCLAMRDEEFEGDESVRPDVIFMERVEDEILDYSGEESAAIHNAVNFEWRGDYPFQDIYEVSFKDFSFHYIWCCFALVWGIDMYDKQKQEKMDEVKELNMKSGQTDEI
jgi:hypothetical protein